jgi:hypothetical protein
LDKKVGPGDENCLASPRVGWKAQWLKHFVNAPVRLFA